MERRRSPRHRAKFDALISGTAHEGAGTLVEISYCGARLAGSSFQPDVGSKVRLYVFVQPVAPFELEGFVVRHAEGGFTIDYDLFDESVRRLVDDVAGLLDAGD